jgi:hypothetical protein
MDMSRRHTRFVFLPSSYLGTEEKKKVRVGSAKEMWRRTTDDDQEDDDDDDDDK